MTRRCSHCYHNGHNSRTCPNRGVKLFGVRLTDGSIRKSASMGNLTHYVGSSSVTPQNGAAANHRDSPGDTPDHDGGGYASEDFVPGSSTSRERKKEKMSTICHNKKLKKAHFVQCILTCGGTLAGFTRCVPWTEEEHRMFLLGLQKLGKGDWRGISRNYVISRTPTQVASHAQKYFIRQSNMSRRKRRSSLFDIVSDESVEAPIAPQDFFTINPPQDEKLTKNLLPPAPVLDGECESMDSTNSNDAEPVPQRPDSSQCCYPVVIPAFISPVLPFSVPLWPRHTTIPVKAETHEVLKPTAVHSKSPINVDELVGMSKLSLGGESLANAGPSSLSLKLVEGSGRQSAFNANPASGSSLVNSSVNPIHAV